MVRRAAGSPVAAPAAFRSGAFRSTVFHHIRPCRRRSRALHDCVQAARRPWPRVELAKQRGTRRPRRPPKLRITTLTFAAAAALTLAAGAAQAGEFRVDQKTTSVGVGLICNTSAQAEQFVELRAKGTEAKDAVAAINDQAHDPRACGLAAIAFVPEKTVQAKPVHDKLMQIVEINVVAGFNGDGWQSVPAMTQYAIVEGQGESI